MIKAPAKFRKPITNELKKFIVHVQSLASKGKSATEEDARIIINDILAYVLGYDKYNDLRTEFKDKNNRLDYVVKLSEGKHSKKKEKYDFVIEAKSSGVDIKTDYINQTLTYCLTAGVDFFIITNAKEWKLFKVVNTKNKKEAMLIWETNLTNGTDIEVLVDEMYVFSKHAYLEDKWDEVADMNKATDVADVMAVIYSEKFMKNIAKTLKDIHNVRISDVALQEVMEKEVFKDFSKISRPLLKKLNSPDKKQEKNTPVIEAQQTTVEITDFQVDERDIA